jgi:hypothetical protein
MAQKKFNIASSVRTILQAAATALHHGLVAKHPKGGGFHLGDLKSKKTFSAKEILTALRIWFDQKVAKYNNKGLHVTDKGRTELARYAGPAPA